MQHTQPHPMNTYSIHSDLPDDVWVSLFLHYSRIPNTNFIPDQTKKRMGLTMIGCTDKEIEELCRPKEVNREEFEEEVKELQRQELKYLAVLDRQRRKMMKPKKPEPEPDLMEVGDIVISEQDIAGLKRMKAENEAGQRAWEEREQLKLNLVV